MNEQWWCYRCGDWRSQTVCLVCGQKQIMAPRFSAEPKKEQADAPEGVSVESKTFSSREGQTRISEPIPSASDLGEDDWDFNQIPISREPASKAVDWSGFLSNVATIGFGSFGFGSALAMVLSFQLNRSIMWAVVHGLLSWVYVLYRAWQGNY
jgi:hypothetical protein